MSHVVVDLFIVVFEHLDVVGILDILDGERAFLLFVEIDIILELCSMHFFQFFLHVLLLFFLVQVFLESLLFLEILLLLEKTNLAHRLDILNLVVQPKFLESGR